MPITTIVLTLGAPHITHANYLNKSISSYNSSSKLSCFLTCMLQDGIDASACKPPASPNSCAAILAPTIPQTLGAIIFILYSKVVLCNRGRFVLN